MSMKALRRALNDDLKDGFEEGTVVRWKGSGIYTYAAVKGGGLWYTSAQGSNAHVRQVLNFKDLLEVLSRAESSEVEVATVWDPVIPAD